jgi:hypothetical protein
VYGRARPVVTLHPEQEVVMSTWKQMAMVAVVSISLAGGAWAQSSKSDEKPAGQVVDLNSFVCKDLMRASGSDRDIGLALLQGYFLGKKGVTTYHSEEVRAITDQFIEYCLDHPSVKVLEAMGKFAH